MSCENPTDDGSAVALTIRPDQVRVLRPLLEMVRDGIHEELGTHLGRVREPARLAREEDAFRRLLAALDGGSVTPDPDLVRALGELAESVDTANEYSHVLAEHDALHGLLAQLVAPRQGDS